MTLGQESQTALPKLPCTAQLSRTLLFNLPPFSPFMDQTTLCSDGSQPSMETTPFSVMGISPDKILLT